MQKLNIHLLCFCISLSLFVHAFCIFILQRHSTWLTSATSTSILSKKEIIKESFYAAKIEKKTPAARLPSVQHSEEIVKYFLPPKEKKAVFAASPQIFHSNQLLSSNTSPRHFQSQKEPSPKLWLPNIDTPIAAQNTNRSKANPLPQKIPEQKLLTSSPQIRILAPQIPVLSRHPHKTNFSSLMQEPAIRRPILAIPAQQLPSFPSLDELETSNYSEHFDVDLIFLSKEDHGYLFAITLIPHQDLNLPKIHQQYYFLIDRANSIQRERLLASKAAVLKAIEDLPSDDTFNIIVFDSKIEKLFSYPKSPDRAAIDQAKTFLDQINLGSFFAPADLYNPLALTLPDPVEEDQVYTAILLTDGQNLSKKNAVRAILQAWTWQNGGRVSLHSICMGNDPQIATLDAACAFNRGHLYYSPTKRGIKRKLTKLMKSIQKPLSKGISYHAITQSEKNEIDLYPRSQQAPGFYLDQPLVILGSCETLDDFVLFVQGRLKDRWMNVKKTISFVNGKKGGNSLRQEWAVQQAYQCYERYIRDDNPEHLAEAKELLEPFHIQAAFQ